MLNCEVLDESPFCAVMGDGPIIERRKACPRSRQIDWGFFVCDVRTLLGASALGPNAF